MPNVNESAFWDELAAALWDDIALAITAIYLQGVEGGIAVLPASMQTLVNFDLVNRAALEYAKNYRYTWIKDITDTTRELTQKAVADWIQSGAPLDVLEQSIANIFGEARASRIAATEATRIFAEANAEVWKSTGFVNQVRFNTSADDRVCPYCGPLDGQEFDVDDYGHKPPIHVNCRCWNTPVVDLDAVNRQLDEALA